MANYIDVLTSLANNERAAEIAYLEKVHKQFSNVGLNELPQKN